jgi:hypothetical protein
VASWAVVASDTVQRRQLGAVWDMRFNGIVVHMGSAAVVDAIGGAIMGLDNFVVTRVGQGMVHYNYDEPWPCHFVGSQRGNTVEGKAGIRRAWLRRELPGGAAGGGESGGGKAEGARQGAAVQKEGTVVPRGEAEA